MSFRRLLLLLLWCILPCVSHGMAAHADNATSELRVAVVTSSHEAPYQETLQALRAALSAAEPGANVEVLAGDSVAAGDLANRRLIVTVGTQAAQRVAELGPARPVLHTLLPASAFERLPRPQAGAPSSAIFLDQPAERQIALLRLALPDWPRVALISGSASDGIASRLRDAATARHLLVRATSVEADDDLYPALQQVLAEPAVLVAVPDPRIFNSYTVQNVLLTAYRNRSPVLGFSAAYVRAGALLGLYSTPAQIGAQAGGVAARVLRGERLPAPAAPAQFEVGINLNVARSLGIAMKPAHELTAELQRRERAQP
ncbi:ABC transporter substrate-binding protein [Thauera sinica]|uniref:ABC transporter substrate-binding protein n=1 Tax=Thauera sinica TaxID=2665146 RepID=A0ABW1AVC8_9RHOO|nr:ABC transporter substrate binding protein [Thauera sp. K11]ATE61016.1 hypothetical protein CCZ27_14660 [Thauera sp. K11]